MTKYKFCDKNHPPVPRLKVGDRCYAHSEFGGRYSRISTCEVRKVEVNWHEPTAFEIEHFGDKGYWHIDYYIRTDVDYPSLKSTKMHAYFTNEDGAHIQSLYFTAQEVMDENIRNFKQMVNDTICEMRSKMQTLGYTENQIRQLLEYETNEHKALTDGTEK